MRPAWLVLVTVLAVAPAQAKVLHVVASFTILADMVREVGGDHVELVSLVGPNGDPHAYEPSPEDAKRLKAADLVFVNGMGLEGWMSRLIAASGYRGVPVVASTGIAALNAQQDGRLVEDPHAWTSAANAIVYVRNIEDALAQADPEDAQDFKASAERYTQTLRALDTYAHQEFDPIPPENRKVITTHESLRYFSKSYGVAFLAPIGLSTETEASAADVARLIRQVQIEHVQVYFFENANDARLARRIAEATGAKPGGALFAEALSAPGGPAPTYAAMFRWNVNAIAKAIKK